MLLQPLDSEILKWFGAELRLGIWIERADIIDDNCRTFVSEFLLELIQSNGDCFRFEGVGLGGDDTNGIRSLKDGLRRRRKESAGRTSNKTYFESFGSEEDDKRCPYARACADDIGSWFG